MHTATWAHKDESQNFQQRYNVNMVSDLKREEVENEIRVHVDELMRQELKTLKLVGGLVESLVGWEVGWLVGGLIGYLVGCCVSV